MRARFTLTAVFLLVSNAAFADAYLDAKTDLEFEKAAGSAIGTAPIGSVPIGGAQASINVIRQLEKILPPLEAAKIAAIDKKLKSVPDDQLLLLEAVPDICSSNLFDCEGLATPLVKPVVSIALEQRRSASSEADAQQTRWISIGGLAISIGSLILSIAAFMRKSEAP
jgi:hypothetical protein